MVATSVYPLFQPPSRRSPMLRALRPLLIAPIALSLWGCTISYKDNTKKPQTPAQNTGAPAAGQPAHPKPNFGPTTTSANTPATQPANTSTSDPAPRINAPIAFGNGTGGA